VAWVEGSFLLLNRRCVERVGGMNPWYRTFWEEADFCRRVRHAGLRVVLVPRALARHHGAGTTRDARLARRRAWLLARNLYIYKLTDPGRSFARNFTSAFRVLLVEAKKCLVSEPAAAWMQVRAFLAVMREIGRAHSKWLDDRCLRHPPITTPAYRYARAEMIR